MKAYRAEDGRIMVPKTAEGPGGLIGDAWIPVADDSEEGKWWLAWYAKKGQEMPTAEKE